MRILHTSDWHLGRTLEGHSRLPEQAAFLEELCKIVEEEKIDLVLIAGDVYDTYNPPAAAEQLFFEALERLNAHGRRAVAVIAGNHDSPDRLKAAQPLASKQGIFLIGFPGEELAGKTNSGLALDEVAAAGQVSFPRDKAYIVQGGSGWLEIAVPGCREHAVLVALPYPSEQRLNQVLSDSLEEQAMQKAYSERVALALAQGAAFFREDTVNLVVSHLYVMGAYTSESERDIQLGGAYAVEPIALPGKAHYVALGHLHRPQKVGGSPVPCRYSGSPLCYSFSESDQQKEVVVVEVIPGQNVKIWPRKLTCGKPLLLKRFKSYQEAYDWCGAPENKESWVYLEIESPKPLSGAELDQLNKAHPGLVFRRVILPGSTAYEEGERLSQLSLEEKFRMFVARETGSAPDDELVTLFLELACGGESDETNPS